MQSSTGEKFVFVLERDNLTGETICHGEGQITGSGSRSFLYANFALTRALDRTFYILEANDAGGLDKISFVLRSGAGMYGPHVYSIGLDSNKQSFPPNKGCTRTDHTSGVTFWEEEDSTIEDSH